MATFRNIFTENKLFFKKIQFIGSHFESVIFSLQNFADTVMSDEPEAVPARPTNMFLANGQL
jgi:hypothetical protein